MAEDNGIDNGKPKTRHKRFDLFRPVSVKPDGQKLTSANWCVRFQHKGKRTCRSLGTADYRLASQRARQLVSSVRQHGWANATILPTSHGSLTIEALLEQYQRTAVSRGLRPRSITHARDDLLRVARETSARRVSDLALERLQSWITDCGLKPITLRSVLKNAASVFARSSVQAMGMADLQDPFRGLIRPKVDREPFRAPPRAWITRLMRQGIGELEREARAGFVLALGAGLRWGEIVSLNWEDLQADGVHIAASKAKGRRARVVPISISVRRVLESSLAQGALITSDASEVHDTLSNWLRNHGVHDAKPVHYLRKCFGSLAVADHGIFLASKLLGHSSITLTASTYAGQVDKLPAVKF